MVGISGAGAWERDGLNTENIVVPLSANGSRNRRICSERSGKKVTDLFFLFDQSGKKGDGFIFFAVWPIL